MGQRVAAIRANRAVNVGWTNRCSRIASVRRMRTATDANSKNRAHLFRAKIMDAARERVAGAAVQMDGVDFIVKLVSVSNISVRKKFNKIVLQQRQNIQRPVSEETVF